MIWYQKIKPFVPKYANYDYTRVYDRNDRCIGWLSIVPENAQMARLSAASAVLK